MVPYDMNLGMSANFLLNHNPHHKTIIKPLHLAQHLLHSEETIHNLKYMETEEYFFFVHFKFQSHVRSVLEVHWGACHAPCLAPQEPFSPRSTQSPQAQLTHTIGGGC